MTRLIAIDGVQLCVSCGHFIHAAEKCEGYDRWNDKCWCDMPMFRAAPNRPSKVRRLQKICACGHSKGAHIPECYYLAAGGRLDCECVGFAEAGA